MIVSLLLATASVVDAERAFARLAQEKGQWTAFRETAAPDAILFWPKPTNAHEALKGLKDPPKSVNWWPTKAWQSCDGTLAVTTGGALWPDGRHGWFTTVWKKQANGGWKWVLDHGGYTDVPRPAPPAIPVTKAADCRAVVLPVPMVGGSPDEGHWRRELVSRDRTLAVSASGYPAGRSVVVRIGSYPVGTQVLLDEVKAAP